MVAEAELVAAAAEVVGLVDSLVAEVGEVGVTGPNSLSVAQATAAGDS